VPRKAVLPVVAGIGTLLWWGHRARNWGATDEEFRATYPGDEMIPEPAGTTTRAVSIAAPAEEVWRWLVQIGQGRGGMYSYDRLENLFGLDIHSAEEVHPEWQDLAVGDRVVLVRSGWMGMEPGYSLPVARLDPGQAIVLRQAPPEHPWNAVWTFVIVPQGPTACRLISHDRAARREGMAGRWEALANSLMEPVTTVMTRRMLLGIKERAERRAFPPAAGGGN
jgi:hypothetical protein